MDQRTLHDQLIKMLAPVFGEEPVFVTDESDLRQFLTGQGCSALPADDPIISHAPLNVVFVPTRSESVDLFWENRNPDSKVLSVPLVAFDPTLENAKYNIRLIAESDFVQALKKNEEVLELLMGASRPLDIHGNGSQLTCRLDGQLEVMAPRTKYPLKGGHSDGIAAFFEVGMIRKDGHAGFHASGVLSVPGVCIAHRRDLEGERIWREAWDFMVSLYDQGEFPLTLELENSRIVKALAGTRDITRELRYYTREDGLDLIELSVGTNCGIDPASVDWHMNSQIHEGMAGVHAGIGDGTTGLHIDFICPGVAMQ